MINDGESRMEWGSDDEWSRMTVDKARRVFLLGGKFEENQLSFCDGDMNEKAVEVDRNRRVD